MFEVIFLFVLGLIWVVFAVVQDLRSREISNWLNFSLVIFALGFRFFYSLFNESFGFFFQGLIGFGIFFVLGNLMYYGRFFAGGDAKLMMSLGAILPIYNLFSVNLKFFLLFFILFLVAGSVYGLSSILYIGIKNHKLFVKGFSEKFSKHKKLLIAITFASCVFLTLGFIEKFYLYIGLFIFVSTYLFICSKVIDANCMVRKIPVKYLREGDWICNNILISKNKKIISSWDGLSQKDIKLLRKNKKFVLIKQGIPFSPVFLIAYVILFIWII